MNSVFEKMKGSALKAAKQGLQILATVSAAASELTSAPLPIPPSERSPQEQLVFLFKAVTEEIDSMAEDEDYSETPETDQRVYNSKLRAYLKSMIVLIQAESDTWIAKYALSPDPEVSDLPCLDTFLQKHIMQELCIRAIRDIPRGCLPLILGASAQLFNVVRYPLLPHQTVHKPIANLVSVASRFDAMNYTSSSSSHEAKQAMTSYKKMIDINLTNLLVAIWRKISENPHLLDYFTLFDLRPSRTGGGAHPLHAQMDVLTALIPLMYKPRVGVFAKRALLTAIGMHDKRVNSFIVLHTSLVRFVNEELGKKFTLALDSLVQVSGTVQPVQKVQISPATKTSLLRAAQTSGQVNIPQTTSQRHTDFNANLESFVKVLMFLDLLVFACVSDRTVATSNWASPPLSPTDSDTASVGSPLTPGLSISPIDWDHARQLRTRSRSESGSCGSSNFAPNISLQNELLSEYRTYFLSSLLLPSITSNFEGMALAANSMVRTIIARLSVRGRDGPLLLETTRFLCFNNTGGLLVPSEFGSSTPPPVGAKGEDDSAREIDVSGLLISRAMSVSKALATSSLQLLHDLISISPLEQALQLLTKESNRHPSVLSPQSSSVPKTKQPIFPSGSDLGSLESAIALAKNPMITIDVGLAEVCTVIASSGKIIDDDPTIERGKGMGLDQLYIDAAAESMLARLSTRLNSLSPSAIEDYSQSPIVRIGAGHASPLIELVQLKLGQYLSMKTDDQLTLAGLVGSCVGLLCTLTVVLPRSIIVQSSHQTPDSMEPKQPRGECYDRIPLEFVLSILHSVESLWSATRRHVLRISDFGIKFSACRHVIMSSSTGKRVDPALRKLIDSESPQNRRLLDSAVMVREMLAEVRGSILAARKLRLSLLEAHYPEPMLEAPVPGDLGSSHSIFFEEDAWERGESTLRSGMDEPKVQIKEEQFLEDFDSLQRGLEDLLGKFTI